MIETNVGWDNGNRRGKVALRIDDKILCASIPSQYAFDEPIVLHNGQERKIDAFPLLFRVKKNDKWIDIINWFDDDTLASENIITEIDQLKYSIPYIKKLFQAVMYKWSDKHNIPLASLGKLNVCVSMPPGAYQKSTLRKQAEKAYEDTFDTGQSHMKLRPVKGETIQLVTKFHSLVREAVIYGSNILKPGELVYVIDLGGGTDDILLFNGSPEPIDSKTYKSGLVHVCRKINFNNPTQAELRILKDKNYIPFPLVTYFNQKKQLVQESLRSVSSPMSKTVYIIGGGAEMINRQKGIKAEFTKLLPPKKVIIKGQYQTAIANLKEASK